RHARLVLACPDDALRPVGVDLLRVGVLVQAQKQERANLLARQRSQFQDHRFGFVGHGSSSNSFPPSPPSTGERGEDHPAIDWPISILLSMGSVSSRTTRRCSSVFTSGKHLFVIRRSF